MRFSVLRFPFPRAAGPAGGRPKMLPPTTPLQRILDLVALGGALLGAVIALVEWTQIPEPVPHHFDWTGTPDSWGSRTLFLILGALPLVAYLALTIAARFPHRADYLVRITAGNATAQYALLRTFLSAMKAWLVFFLTSLIWQTARVATGQAEQLHPLTMWIGAAGPIAFALLYVIASFTKREGETS